MGARGSTPPRSDGRSSGSPKRGLRPPPGAQPRGASGRCASSPLDRRARRPRSPSSWASSTSRDQLSAGAAPGTRWATATASSVTSGSSWAASAASSSGPGVPCTRPRAAVRRSAASRRPGHRASRTRLGEPEAELLHEVEREAVAARGVARRAAPPARPPHPGVRRPGAPFDVRPRRSRSPAGRASDMPVARLRDRASATAPYRHSRIARVRVWPLPRAARRSRTRASEPRAAPPGQGARRLAPCRALL